MFYNNFDILILKIKKKYFELLKNYFKNYHTPQPQTHTKYKIIYECVWYCGSYYGCNLKKIIL